MFKRILSFLALVAAVVLSAVSQAHATIAELFAAVDIAGVSTNVQTLLIAFIGITLLFVGYRFIKKTLRG